jgi:hypothetical protein
MRIACALLLIGVSAFVLIEPAIVRVHLIMANAAEEICVVHVQGYIAPGESQLVSLLKTSIVLKVRVRR